MKYCSILLGLLVSISLAACSTASEAPPSTGVQAPKASAEPAPPPAAESQPPAGAERQIAPDVSSELKAKAASFLKAQGVSVDTLRVFEVKTFPHPDGFAKTLLAVSRERLLLLAADESGSSLKLLAAADFAANPAKIWVSSSRTSIHLLSQAPFSASQVEVTLQWDGTRLAVTEKSSGDPSRAFYDRREQLIRQGDLAALKQLDDKVLYPDRYQGYFSQPKGMLELAYQESLKRYRAGDLKGALADLEFGIGKYTEVFGPLLSPKEPLPAEARPEYRLRPEELVPIANDYAFFLAEYGNEKAAQPLLEKVISVDPGRTVAYLNLGDVLWNLGDKAGARKNYQLYLDRLGSQRDVAPARVLERLK